MTAGSHDALRHLAEIPEEQRTIVITVTANQHIIGGMTYALQPDKSGDRDGNDRDRDEHHSGRDGDRGHDASRVQDAQANQLVRRLVRDLGEVRDVRISKVMLEVRFDDD